ncbi:MAG TPA: leucine--tRNA ligase [Candidatus Limnocylindrales bacterium]|nr:leucine--tRNA ligase [Candidatus Limnocylindrales bacterium]
MTRDIERYDPIEIEPRWQQRWDELGLHKTDLDDDSRPRYYVLTMYDYPSGDLHIGHWFVKTPTDAISRYKRMQGFNVFFPVGFDSFGLPAENAAIRSGVHPRAWTLANIDKMRRQLKSMGATWDWSAEVVTSDADYYRWNQWFFLKFLENDLAYREMAPVDWCPKDQVVLAREQVIGTDRVCWRCGTQVIKRDLEQWFFRTTKYADEYLSYDGIDFPDPIRVMQTNWVGRSEGAEVVFTTDGGDPLPVFTTRPDTLFGATFMVLAPEHPLVEKLTAPDRKADVEAYLAATRRKSEIDRLSTDREKTGVPVGAFATNPINGEQIPIWIADYVLAGYGTGAIMAVPAHDERDFSFAQKFGLSIRQVVAPPSVAESGAEADLSEAYSAHTADEVLVNSGDFTGMLAVEGGRRITRALEKDGRGKSAVTYRLRDWLISRQRAWGTPIPVVYCKTDQSCGIVPVPFEQLPVLLPEDFEFKPGGGNALETDERFTETTCPQCGGPGRRETDTMDTFMDSSWYWWRYLSAGKTDGPIDTGRAAQWTPVAQYTGGAEHAVMHLLYARFFTKALNDLGLVHEREPWLRLFNQGQILGADGERMSKSRGNVQDPDELVSRYGADTVRLFLMFMGPWDQGGPWSPTGIEGVHRFLRRVWTVVLDPRGREAVEPSARITAEELQREAHRAVAKVTEDHEGFRYNTMISVLMELTNAMFRGRGTDVVDSNEWDETCRLLLLMLAPIAPHISEDLWSRRLAGRGEEWRSVHQERWPEFDASLVAETEIELPIQINGKLRDVVNVPAGLSEIEIEQIVMSRDKVQAQLARMEVVRVIHVRDRMVNVVVKPAR